MKAGRPGGPRGNQWQGHHRGNHQRPQCQNPEKGTTQNETQKNDFIVPVVIQNLEKAEAIFCLFTF